MSGVCLLPIFFPHKQFKSFIVMLMLISSGTPSKNPLPVSSYFLGLLIWKCVLSCCPPVLNALFPSRRAAVWECLRLSSIIIFIIRSTARLASLSWLDAVQQSLSSPPVLHAVFFFFFFFPRCRKDFEELFDVIITNALKPGFFSLVPQQRPFKTLGE